MQKNIYEKWQTQLVFLYSSGMPKVRLIPAITKKAPSHSWVVRAIHWQVSNGKIVASEKILQ